MSHVSGPGKISLNNAVVVVVALYRLFSNMPVLCFAVSQLVLIEGEKMGVVTSSSSSFLMRFLSSAVWLDDSKISIISVGLLPFINTMYAYSMIQSSPCFNSSHISIYPKHVRCPSYTKHSLYFNTFKHDAALLIPFAATAASCCCRGLYWNTLRSFLPLPIPVCVKNHLLRRRIVRICVPCALYVACADRRMRNAQA